MPAHDPELRVAYATQAVVSKLQGLGPDERRALVLPAVQAIRERDLATVDAEAHRAGEILTPQEREYRVSLIRKQRSIAMNQARSTKAVERALGLDAESLADALERCAAVATGGAA